MQKRVHAARRKKRGKKEENGENGFLPYGRKRDIGVTVVRVKEDKGQLRGGGIGKIFVFGRLAEMFVYAEHKA